MHVRALSIPARIPIRTRGRRTFGIRLLGCFFLVGLATLFCGFTSHGMFLWIANGILLAYLLLAPRKLWRWYLVAALAAHIAVSPFMHSGWALNLFFSPYDILEAGVAAYLLRRRSTDLPDFTNAFYLLRFIVCAVLVAPLLISLIYAALSSWWLHTPFLPRLGTWFLSESLGVLVSTPATVAVFRSGPRDSSPQQQDWLMIGVVVAFCALLLGLSSFVGPALLFPLLVFVLLRLGLGWASLATLAATGIGAWYTSRGIGPFALGINSFTPGIRLQGFIVCVMVVLHSVSLVLENLRKTERRLQQIAALHALVAENSRDVILLLDFEGKRNFISAPEQFWGGWTRAEIENTSTMQIVHPDDAGTFATVLADLRARRDSALIEVRVQRKDGTYAWIEAALRTVRDPITHLPTGILANIREVTQRKEAELELEFAYQKVEALSVTDPLTGLANRRRFDQTLNAEWRRALREQNPLSLLLIDADHFKNFNDTYGHPAGDACLKQIADSVVGDVSRATDLACRIGGEEFAILLPNTSGPAARALANHICDSVRSRQIPHTASPREIVTISIGCATVIPQAGQNSAFLVDLADQALYSAKRGGRDCVYPPAILDLDDSAATQSAPVGLA